MPTVTDGASGKRARYLLSELGEKIFLDRYALKDGTKRSIRVGDTVVVCTNTETGQREIGRITKDHAVIGAPEEVFEVELRDGTNVYRGREHLDKPLEVDPEEMIRRVARGIAAMEKPDQVLEWYAAFQALMDDWKFVPAGRILAAAGTDQALSYYNCYLVNSPHDSRAGIVATLSEMMEIMSRGGGVGVNISSLRPRHAYVKGVNGRSSGSVSWGALYSFATGLIEQGGSRRGAIILMLNCWHPDVMEFINAKREAGKITNANISVGITDDFMAAVEADAEWELVFPDTGTPDYDQQWSGDLAAWRAAGNPVVVHERVKARAIWNAIIESAWASAEPGVYFIDTANKESNSFYYAPLLGTNPCGEVPLPANAVCNLGSLNLPKFLVRGPDGSYAVSWDQLRESVRAAVRFLDNVIDATPYFFEANRVQQALERRIGLNTMGLAEMLIRLGIRYGSPEALAFIDQLYEVIATEAYLASVEIAKEKGPFPQFNAERFLQSGYMARMPERVRMAVAEHGIRNVTLLTQAPTGTIGTMMGTSTGIEPFFAWTYWRKSRLGMHEEKVAVVKQWQDAHPGEPLPDYFVTAMDLTPEEHVRMQAAIQKWVDAAISKTCNVPSGYTVEQTRELYEMMYRLGCKGGTVYRDGSRDEQVLNVKAEAKPEPAPVPAAPPEPAIRPKPYKRGGVTISKKTPAGTAHITMTHDEAGEPLELFMEIGKAGSDVTAMAEALGRLVSMVLRINSVLTPRERVREVIRQLGGIGGTRFVGFGASRVRSLPDAVAQALKEHYFDAGEAPKEEKKAGGAPPPMVLPGADLCPECGEMTFVRQDGCASCLSCGFSECG